MPSWSISLAPMCWVMPPRSPAATSVERRASSRLVLPWSTWPMTVTIGARGWSFAASSSSKRSSLVGLGRGAFGLAVGSGAVRRRGDGLGHLVAELGRDEGRGVTVDQLVDGREDPALDQLADDVRDVDRQQLGELLDGDRAGQLDRAALARIDRLDLRSLSPPSRRGGLRGPRRPRVPLLLLATGSSFDGVRGDGSRRRRPRGTRRGAGSRAPVRGRPS